MLAVAQGVDIEQHRFLTRERIERLGRSVAPLLADDLSWIERRKEAVEIVDDTALRRRISVDFSLRGAATPLLVRDPDDPRGDLYSAPAFVIPKAAGRLMAFDLEDEDRHALTLISRRDNARISGEALVKLADISLGDVALPEALADELREIAVAEAGDAKLRAKSFRFRQPLEHAAELAELREDDRFCWWLSTFAHSSLVVVLFRSHVPRRKLVKLSYEQPVTSEPRWTTKLGWDPYRIAIDSPLIEARTYHLEAQAPPGLRIVDAALSDNTTHGPVRARGFMRRVHLYRAGAHCAGAGTAVLWLAVTSGFIGGAAMASFLAATALIACAIWTENLAVNPTSAPALLLALPGLIASYVARPDQHALTTRLLSWARRLVLWAGFFAFAGAVRVALSGRTPTTPAAIDDRVCSLRWSIIPLAALATLIFFVLAATYVRSRTRPRTDPVRQRMVARRFVRKPSADVLRRVLSQDQPVIGRGRYAVIEHVGGSRVVLLRRAWYGRWFATVTVQEDGRTTIVTLALDYRIWLPSQRIVARLVDAEAHRISQDLNVLEAWR